MKAAAVAYARILGLAVFPVGPDCRTPLIKTGCHAASKDPDVVARMFAERPHANLAAALGHVSGAMVVDVDVKEGQPGLASLEKLQQDYGQLPDSWISTTPSGGRHLWFAQPTDKALRNRVCLKVYHPDRTVSRYDGLDIRTTGGSACLPPSKKTNGSYGWLQAPSDLPLAPCPAWLARIIDPPPPPRRPVQPLRLSDADKVARYVAAAVDRECHDLANTGRGGRNHKLFVASANLGSFVGAGVLSEDQASHALEQAADACGLMQEEGPHACRATIQSGLRKGIANPREMPA